MKRVLLVMLVGVIVGLGSACAQGGGGAGGESAPAKAEKPAQAPIPSSSPLAKIEMGMNDTDVRRILGEPTRANAYMTGKAFIPFYFGPDTARTDWMYSGVGRVVFSRNTYSGSLKVINVIHNPDE